MSEYDAIEAATAANCPCRDCCTRRREATIVALRECVRIRTEERDAALIDSPARAGLARIRAERDKALGQRDAMDKRNGELSDEIMRFEARVAAQSLDIGGLWKRQAVLERRNKALALEVEALETHALALHMELETRPSTSP